MQYLFATRIYYIAKDRYSSKFTINSNYFLLQFIAGDEIGRISAECEKVKWLIFLNGEWVYLGKISS